MCPTCIEKSLDYLIQKGVVNEKVVNVFYQGVRFLEINEPDTFLPSKIIL
tara:strand:- start:59 stop:208 length:150 start_codon:yes stop_codon:yes gene_type:complete